MKLTLILLTKGLKQAHPGLPVTVRSHPSPIFPQSVHEEENVTAQLLMLMTNR